MPDLLYRCAVLTMSPGRSILATGRFIILQLADRVSGAVLNHVAPLVCEFAFVCHSFVIYCQHCESIERKPETLRAMGCLKPLHILDRLQAARFSCFSKGGITFPKKPRIAGSTSVILLYTLAIGSERNTSLVGKRYARRRRAVRKLTF